MKDEDKTKKQLINKLVELRQRITRLEKEDTQLAWAEEAQRLQNEILMNMPKGVNLTRTADGTIFYTNQKFDEMFGYDKGQLIGKHVSVLNALVEESPEEITKRIIKKLNEKGVWSGEIANKKKDGTIFCCRASVSTMEHSQHGEIWVAVQEDITKLKQTEEALKKIHDELELRVEERTAGLQKGIVEHKKAEEAKRQTERALTIRNKIADIFLTFPDDEMYGEVLQTILEFMGSKHGVFGYMDEHGAMVCPSMTRDIWEKCKIPDKNIIYPRETWGNGLWCRAIRERKVLYQNEASCEPKGHIPVSRSLAVPIIHHREVIGIILVGNKPTDYTKEDRESLEAIANHIAPVLNPRLQRDRQEKERRQAEEALRESEERFRSLFESAPEFIHVLDTEGRILKTNPMTVKSLGYSEEELIGQPIARFFTPDSQKIFERECLVLMEKGVNRQEVELVCKDGRILTVDCSAMASRNERGEITSFVVYERDITERKKMERELMKHKLHLEVLVEERTGELKAAVEQLQREITERKQAEKEKERLNAQLVQSEKMAGIGTLTSGIAHEFNNLLQIIRGHAEFAQKTKKAEDMEEALDVVLNNSDKAMKIIGDLLTFSRQETSEKEQCDIIEQIESVLLLIEEQLEKHNIEVVRRYKEIPQIEVNRREIQQVFLNVIKNAWDAMLPKGGKLEIRVKRVKENVEVSISDTGKGIEKENVAKVFEPFFTTKRAVREDDKLEGTGLGLSVSYGIVKRHGGTIEVRSERGKKTTFTIKLPAKRGGIKKGSEEKREVAKPEFLNILVVDDEEEINRIFVKWLSLEGLGVKSALTGKKAVNLVKKMYFDIVFLDIVMPGIAGIDLLEEIRRISPETKVVIITGKLINKNLLKRLKQKGASGFLRKPFKMADLMETIRKKGKIEI